MAKGKNIEVKNGNLEGHIRELLREFLQKGIVDAVLVPQEVASGDNVVQTLVVDPGRMEKVRVLAPVMPVNSARIVSAMTKVSPSPKRVGVVMRPCEMRAFVELIKLKQAAQENLVLIGIDCHGTYSVEEYARLSKNGGSAQENYWKAAREGKEDQSLRTICQICEYPTPLGADLTIGFIGLTEIRLESGSSQGEQIFEKMGWEADEDGKQRETAVSELVTKRTKKRDELFQELKGKVQGLENLLSVLATCINCHNCKTACPLCYCKECFFDSSTFEWEAEQYLGWAERQGLMRMPTDTLLFHLTRMVHMAHSCVGCGACSEACPNNIPVADLFRLVGRDVQAIFDYVPGRKLEEPIPITTFREDELKTVGEK